MELTDLDLETVAGGKGQRRRPARGVAASEGGQRMLGLGLAVSAGGRSASVGMGAARSAATAASAAPASRKPSLGVGGDCPGGVCR